MDTCVYDHKLKAFDSMDSIDFGATKHSEGERNRQEQPPYVFQWELPNEI